MFWNEWRLFGEDARRPGHVVVGLVATNQRIGRRVTNRRQGRQVGTMKLCKKSHQDILSLPEGHLVVNALSVDRPDVVHHNLLRTQAYTTEHGVKTEAVVHDNGQSLLRLAVRPHGPGDAFVVTEDHPTR